MRSKANEALARQCARDLLEAQGIKGAPIDPEAIAAADNLAITEREDGFPSGAFGALVKEGPQRFRVLLSTACPTRGHRRFTIAHELGHFHIPGHMEVMLGQGEVHVSLTSNFRSRRDWWEVEADLFASELLMPQSAAIGFLLGRPVGLNSVRELAGHFDVSLSAAAIRYTQLTDTAVIVILSRDGEVEWTSSSEPVRDHKWARRLRRKDWAPPRSATKVISRSKDLLLSGAIRSCDLEPLASWIDHAPPIPLKEEALGLGSYGRVLTVLTIPSLPTPEALEHMERRRETGPRTWTSGLRTWSLDDIEAPE